jgi:hypothetical protein
MISFHLNQTEFCCLQARPLTDTEMGWHWCRWWGWRGRWHQEMWFAAARVLVRWQQGRWHGWLCNRSPFLCETCHPSYWRPTCISDSPWVSPKTRWKVGWASMPFPGRYLWVHLYSEAQVVERLSSKCKALSSNPSTVPKKRFIYKGVHCHSAY